MTKIFIIILLIILFFLLSIEEIFNKKTKKGVFFGFSIRFVLLSALFSFLIPIIYKFFSNIGTDSFVETQNTSIQEALFYLSTFENVFKLYFRLESFLYYFLFSFLVFFLVKKMNIKKYTPRKIYFFIPFIFFIFTNFTSFKLNSHLYNQLESNRYSVSSALFLNNNFLELNDLKIVFYVGEATSALNFSAYGYPFQTTPYISELINSRNAFKYDNVFATYSHTTPSLIDIFTIDAEIKKEPTDVYNQESFFLTDVLKYFDINYFLYSNQESSGSFNFFSPLMFGKNRLHSSDNQLFGNKFNFADKIYDHEFLKSSFEKHLIGSTNPELILLHSYAGHGSYLKHIPKKFSDIQTEQFYEKHHNYLFQPTKTKNDNLENLIKYDKAMRYIDFSLHTLITSVMNRTEPIVFIYMPDHGDDSFKNYGHDSMRPSFGSFYIPAFVLFNNSAKNKFPQVVQMIQKDVELSKENISFAPQLASTILEIFGIQIKTSLQRLGHKNIDKNYFMNVLNKNFKKKFVDFHDISAGDEKFKHLFKTKIMSMENKDKIFCLHGSNNIESIIKGLKVSNCLESDLVIQDDGIYVQHPPQSNGFDFITYLDFVNRSENSINLWFDIKNLDEKNFNSFDNYFENIINSEKVNSVMLELPPESNLDDSALNDYLSRALIKYDSKNLEFSIYLQPRLVDDCVEKNKCSMIDLKIAKAVGNKNIKNISFDKKLNRWDGLQKYRHEINFNSWSYYASDINSEILSHKRIIYKNKD